MKTIKPYGKNFKTQFGTFQLWATPRGLYRLEFGRSLRRILGREIPTRVEKTLSRTARVIQNYLKGGRANFQSLPIDWSDIGVFEKRVLRILRQIPPGKTSFYQELALKAGRPRTVRYVGRIMAKNRLPLILPCHRVLPKAGGWGGFSKGIRWKKRLLKLEQARADKN